MYENSRCCCVDIECDIDNENLISGFMFSFIESELGNKKFEEIYRTNRTLVFIKVENENDIYFHL